MSDHDSAPLDLRAAPTLVVGAGLMGAGIAQVAAQSGHPVLLFDARAGAAAGARDKLKTTLDGLVAKGKLAASEAESAIGRIQPIDSLAEAAGCTLVVEAIVENLAAKRALFAELEGIVAPQCVLATNTSSISVTAISNGLKHPARLVGMHFFNPVPLMKLVEVVHGLHTAPAVAEAIYELSRVWGKVPVHAKSTPGFIVNRIARPFYAEALALLLEQALAPNAIDTALRAAGFRMGPCELMDLVGHDTNFAVTCSVYDANFQDKRYQPSLVQREMVDGGLFGRKSGRGFYPYPEGAPPLAPPSLPALAPVRSLVVHGEGPIADALEAAATRALADQGWGPARERSSGWTGLALDEGRIAMTDGRTAQERAAEFGLRDVAVFDWPLQVLASPAVHGGPLAMAVSAGAGEAFGGQAAAWLAALGHAPLPMSDAPGLVVARTVSMLVNEAADAALQGVCTPAGANQAMKLGVSYPAGPFEWLERLGTPAVLGVLQAMDAHYRGERYRISPWLRRQAA